MKCWWCQRSIHIPAFTITVDDEEIGICAECLWGGLHAGLKLNKYGPGVFPDGDPRVHKPN